MSWFNVGYSEKHLKQMDQVYKKKYGKNIKKISERKEFDLLPVADQEDHNDSITDQNIDDVIDYSDKDKDE